MNRAEMDTWAPLSQALLYLQGEEYCLVKKKLHFPNIPQGSDVDLYVGDLEKSRSAIRSGLSKLLDCEASLSEEWVEPDHLHIDLLSNNRLILRFDLYATTPAFKRLQLTPEYFRRVLESRQVEIVNGPRGEEVSLYVPSKEMEYVLRVCEYAEFYWMGPDKIQHVDYLLGSAGLTRVQGLAILHEVTEVPTTRWDSEESAFGAKAVSFRRSNLVDWLRSWASVPGVKRMRHSRIGSRIESLARGKSVMG